MSGKKRRWSFAYSVSHIAVKYLFGNKVTYDKQSDLDAKEPFILLGNHSCFYDFLFAIKAMGPYPIRFVVAAKYFTSPFVASFLNFYGAIPKKLADKDFDCMRTIRTSLKNGESVGIYPEGRVSMWGTTEYINASTAKLVKRLNCNLVLVQNLGGFFLNPPYGGGRKFGRTDTRIYVYDKEQLATMSSDEIYQLIHRVLFVNQYDWYKEKRRKLVGREKVNKLPYLLYRCPDCNEIMTIGSKRNRLTCSKCGLAGEVKNAHIQWNRKSVPESISDLYVQYKAYEKMNVLSPEFSLGTSCEIEIIDLDSGDKQTQQNKTVTMDQEVIHLGLANDEDITISLDTIDYLPFDVGSNFQIYREGKLYIIKPYDKSLPTAYSVMHEAMKELRLEIT